ncbi:hypothetical protein FN976_05475 [Caenimonas sedimenti]|uniref:Uncharacterized protein n=1 Tax=Caenimonas sedimenti TaxID=2596921 RepID=A0A562ZVF9_9BURK|nr:hypothetical protein [Caenimonas sedimenti]TWO72164.1 hypothetical protein FN976_05475 [Caenimonas sedimenti]
MPRTFASVHTKRAVLAPVTELLLRNGYRLIETDKATLNSTFERRLSGDTSARLWVTFFDGPIAGKHIVWLSGIFSLRSVRLVELYERLAGEPAGGEMFPVSASLDHFVESYGAGGVKFELPDLGPSIERLRRVVEIELDSLASELDSAEKQAEKLVAGVFRHTYWNPRFFKPVGLLLLGKREEAVAAAGAVMERDGVDEVFRRSYSEFYGRVRENAV